jgi:F-type H+-transporting ATPase subunit alpha
MYAVINGYIDDVPQDKIRDFEIAFHRYMETSHSDVINAIMEKRELDEEITASLHSAITEFKKAGVY